MYMLEIFFCDVSWNDFCRADSTSFVIASSRFLSTYSYSHTQLLFSQLPLHIKVLRHCWSSFCFRSKAYDYCS